MRYFSWFLLLLLSMFLFAGCRPSTPGATASASPTILPGKIVPTPTGTSQSAAQQQADFSALHMFDAHNGWALVNGHVWYTTDGGLHWRNVTPKAATPAAPVSIDTADFVTASLAWVAFLSPGASTTNIEETMDGGQTWRANALQIERGEISFINPQDGWVCANGGAAAGSSAFDLFRTTDGGATWARAQDTQQIVNGAPGALPFGGDKNCPGFINATTGWVTGYEPVDNFRYFYVTHDGGFHWQVQSLPPVPGASAQYSTLAPIFFSNDTRDGVLPTQLYTSPSAQSVVAYVTRDGGASWQSTNPIPAGSWMFLDAQHGWVVQGGDLWVTGNGGQSWSRLTPGGPFQNVFTLDFISRQEGWAAARDTFQPLVGQHTANGVLLHTTDGGQTWTALNYMLI